MNKSQLIDTLAARYQGNRKAAAHALESVLDTITREVARGEKVAITGFGSFEKRVRPARWVRNPQTGERLKAKKTAVPKFNPGADLKNVISGAKKLPKLTLASLPQVPGMAAAKKAAAKRPTATKAAPAKKAPARRRRPRRRRPRSRRPRSRRRRRRRPRRHLPRRRLRRRPQRRRHPPRRRRRRRPPAEVDGARSRRRRRRRPRRHPPRRRQQRRRDRPKKTAAKKA